jgi:hypothetical protein|tara:strand:+ start:1295 stop:1591 length:297 start_codon:yes stop_codon:yes gene_type:complete
MPIGKVSDTITATGNIQRGSTNLKSGILTGIFADAVTDAGTVVLREGGSGGTVIFPTIRVATASTFAISGLEIAYVAPLHATIDDTNTTLVVTTDEGT